MEETGVYILHEKERNLIKFIRGLQFGEVTIKVQDGLRCGAGTFYTVCNLCVIGGQNEYNSNV